MITFTLILILMFTFNYQNINLKNRINNTFSSLSSELPDTWISLIRSDDKQIPLYNKSKVKESSISYFKNNLKGYVNNFDLIFYFYDINDKKEYIGDYSSGVKLSLYIKEIEYIKSINFEIGGNIL